MLKFYSMIALILLGLLLSGCVASTDVVKIEVVSTEVPTPVDGGQVTVARVLDGDTVVLDDGRQLRYVGINAPEHDQPYFEEAREANRRLVEGKEAAMVLDVQPTDRFGRVLAHLWVDDQFVNAELVRLGYANAYTQPPNVRFAEEILAAEQEARSAEVGLWTPADIPIRIRDIHYDAPGRDHQNPNGEWVVLINDGSETVNLAALTLKDEAQHLFTFPELSLEPGQWLRVYSGRGKDSDRVLYWGLVNDSVWNNDGDTAFLRDPTGRLVDSFGY